HRLAVVDAQIRAVRHLVALALAAELVDDRELARAGRRDQMSLLLVPDGLQVLEPDRARALDLDAVDGSRPRRRAADVERPHRELRARLADRLRRDDTDRLALVHAMTARKVAPVALRADAVLRLARDRRAREDLVDRVRLELRDHLLVEQGPGRDDHVVRARRQDIDGRDAAEHALAQRLDDVAALDERRHHDAVLRAAVLLGHDEVLRDVDEAAGEVTRVRGLERRIGETLTRAVRRDEVLQDVQTLAEVRGDRRLDDRAVRLRHQAAHAGELTDLR